MLGLPKATEISKALPKKMIYAKFQLDSAAKARFDEDITRLALIHEITPANVNFKAGETVKAIFILQVTLKRRAYDEKNLQLLSKLIPQNLLFLLDYEGEQRLAVFRARLLQSPWFEPGELTFNLSGTDLNQVWDNLVLQLSGLKREGDNTIEEQVLLEEQREKIRKEIDRLERRARTEKQPSKAFALVQQKRTLEEKLKEG